MTTTTRIMLLVLLGVVTVMNQSRAAAQEAGLLARLSGRDARLLPGRTIGLQVESIRHDRQSRRRTRAVHGGYALRVRE